LTKSSKTVIKQNILAKNLILNTILFADDHVIVTSTEGELQRAVYTLNNITIKYNLKIIKTMAVKGKMNVRNKTVIITQLNK
jgi:hypothetical protein